MPISLGELIDKITILEIKAFYMNGQKLINVKKELEYLNQVIKEKNICFDEIFFKKLKKVNNKLWIIEDKIRKKELLKEFDKEFINLARMVYKVNDLRASMKKKINLKYNSSIIEEKFFRNKSLLK